MNDNPTMIQSQTDRQTDRLASRFWCETETCGRCCRHGAAAVRSSLSFEFFVVVVVIVLHVSPFTVARQKHRLAFPFLLFCCTNFNRKWCRVDACFLRVIRSRRRWMLHVATTTHTHTTYIDIGNRMAILLRATLLLLFPLPFSRPSLLPLPFVYY
jgi:hypothetical protein